MCSFPNGHPDNPIGTVEFVITTINHPDKFHRNHQIRNYTTINHSDNPFWTTEFVITKPQTILTFYRNYKTTNHPQILSYKRPINMQPVTFILQLLNGYKCVMIPWIWGSHSSDWQKFTDVSENVVPLSLGSKSKTCKNRARTSRQSMLSTRRQYAPSKRRCLLPDYTALHPKSDYSSCYLLLLFCSCCRLFSRTTKQAANRKANNSPIRKLNSHSTL